MDFQTGEVKKFIYGAVNPLLHGKAAVKKKPAGIVTRHELYQH